jgi:hypothetical protein
LDCEIGVDVIHAQARVFKIVKELLEIVDLLEQAFFHYCHRGSRFPAVHFNYPIVQFHALVDLGYGRVNEEDLLLEELPIHAVVWVFLYSLLRWGNERSVAENGHCL